MNTRTTLLSVEEVCRRYGCSRSHAYKHLLPFLDVVKDGTRTMVVEASFEAHVANLPRVTFAGRGQGDDGRVAA